MKHPGRNKMIALNGKTISENFNSWMRYGVIKRVLYHATQANFDSFDTSKSDLGAHFGSIEQAHHLESRVGIENGLFFIPVWISITNPIRLNDVGSFHADGIAIQLEKKKLLPKGEGKRIESEIEKNWKLRKKYDPILLDILKEAGFDGVVYKNQHEGAGDSYIVFDAKNIKSALGNSGLFLPDSCSLTDYDAATKIELANEAKKDLRNKSKQNIKIKQRFSC